MAKKPAQKKSAQKKPNQKTTGGEKLRTIPVERARRLALGAQGFSDQKPTGAPTVRHFRRVMDRMTILQVDSVNVICRSHFLPVFARLGPYDRDKLDAWLWQSRENFEYFSHVASLTNVEHQPNVRFRMQHPNWVKGKAKFDTEQPGYLEAVMAELDEHGSRSIKELDDPGGRTGPWWGYSKGKTALEYLYLTGETMVENRDKNFTVYFDLPERVLPADVAARPTPTDAEAFKALLMLGAKSHGIGTATDLADYFRLKMPSVRPLLKELVADGELEMVQVEGWADPAYLHPDAKIPRAINASTFLTPFDPVCWFRPRAERLFDFHYRIEIYVPEPKRVYGYYVLPFLHGDRLVGRADIKADRKAGMLLAKGIFGEAHADPDTVAPAMAANLHTMAEWLGLDGVDVGKKGDLAGAVAEAVG